jgi:predicted ATP-dependent endonuclease of OLD family
MELLYIWIEKYKSIENQEFNFGSDFYFNYNSDRGELEYYEYKNKKAGKFFEIEGMESKLEITNINAIIGKNGSGKSSLLGFIESMFRGSLTEKSIMIFRNKDKVYIFHKKDIIVNENIKEKIINIKKENIELFSYNTLDLSQTKWNTGTSERQSYKEMNNTYIIYYTDTYNEKEVYRRTEKGSINNYSKVFDISRARYYEDAQINKTNSMIDIEYVNKISYNDKIDFILKFKDMIKFLPTKINIRSNNSYLSVKKREILKYIDDEKIYSKHENKIKKIDNNDWIGKFVLNIIDIFIKYNKISEIYMKEFMDNGMKCSNTSEFKKILDLIIDKMEEDIKKYGIDKTKFIIENFIPNNNEEVNGRNNKGIHDEDRVKLLKLIENNRELFQSGERTGMVNKYEINDETKEIISKYFDCKIGYGFFDFSWEYPLSSGEEYYLEFFSKIYSVIKEKIKNNMNIIILLDEPDLYLHPEWQREFIYDFIKILNEMLKEKKIFIQIILTSHSPFVISDLPRENVILLKKEDGKTKVETKEMSSTFAANIHTLFKNSFFVTSTFGEFAKNKIKDVINHIENGEIEENKEMIDYIISIVGEPLIKTKLENMSKEEKIKELQAEIDRLNNGEKNDNIKR